MAAALAGRRALVTGSTSGIGLGIARSLAAAGCGVVHHGLGSPSEIEALVKATADDHGVSATFAEADLLEVCEIEEMMAQHDDIDILVRGLLLPISLRPRLRGGKTGRVTRSCCAGEQRGDTARLTARGFQHRALGRRPGYQVSTTADL